MVAERWANYGQLEIYRYEHEFVKKYDHKIDNRIPSKQGDTGHEAIRTGSPQVRDQTYVRMVGLLRNKNTLYSVGSMIIPVINLYYWYFQRSTDLLTIRYYEWGPARHTEHQKYVNRFVIYQKLQTSFLVE